MNIPQLFLHSYVLMLAYSGKIVMDKFIADRMTNKVHVVTTTSWSYKVAFPLIVFTGKYKFVFE